MPLKMSPGLDSALCALLHCFFPVLQPSIFESWIPPDSMRLPCRQPSRFTGWTGVPLLCYLGSNSHRVQITSIKLTLSSLCSRAAQMLSHPPCRANHPARQNSSQAPAERGRLETATVIFYVFISSIGLHPSAI